jgi:hypothetical protein
MSVSQWLRWLVGTEAAALATLVRRVREAMRQVSVFLRRHLPVMLGALVLLAVVVVVWIFSAPIASWLRSGPPIDAVTFLQEHLLAVGLLGGCLLILALIWLPKWQASRVQDVKDRLTVENAARQTLAQIVGGAVLMAGLFFTWANLDVAQKNIQITQETATKNQDIAREGQITDRFTKAISQLGEQAPEKLAVRLGGIYALERIAKESKDEHLPIMEILTAYVRESVPWVRMDNLIPPPIAPEIQAILTVLGRRHPTHPEYSPLNLKGAVLRKADLAMADLRQVDLSGANLREANLIGAHLEEANLSNVHLQFARLWETHLEGANLYSVRLEHASLRGAYLQRASLPNVGLWSASLWKAHLEGAHLGSGFLDNAIFQEAHLEGANLSLTSMKGAQLQEAHLEGANLAGADLG